MTMDGPDGREGDRSAGAPGAAVGAVAAVAAGICACIFLLYLLGAGLAGAQTAQEDERPASETGSESGDPEVDIFAGGGGLAAELLHVPVVTLYPGTVPVRPTVDAPIDDPAAVQRGARYYNRFNCVGCHAPNGGGGMGRSLSNSVFIYGGEPANIFLSILQGRPAGMPAWGGMLPDQVIWDLVAYIRSISREPQGQWGRTTSVEGFSIEQVPAEYLQTTDPWRYTTPFSYGQAPFEKPKGSPPLETPER